MSEVKNILLTGASGFIGTHVAKAAVEKGYNIYALVRRSSDIESLKKRGITFIYGDITDKESLKLALLQITSIGISFDYVIHAAALTKATSEEIFMKSNAEGTRNLMDALAESGIKPEKVVFLSSLAACGPEEFGRIIDKEKSKPITQYGKSKLAAEGVLKSYTQFPYVIIRPTAVYGPGEKDLFSVFKIVKLGINPILGNNPQELTFINVKDLTEFILAALKSKHANKTYFATDGLVYDKASFGKAIANSMNKNVTSIKIPLPLVKGIAFLSQNTMALFGKLSPLNLEKYKELTAQSWNCDIEETIKELNYIPAVTLHEGVAETTNWYKKNKWI